MLCRRAWGRIGRRAAHLLLERAFGELGFLIWLIVRSDNEKVAEFGHRLGSGRRRMSASSRKVLRHGPFRSPST